MAAAFAHLQRTKSSLTVATPPVQHNITLLDTKTKSPKQPSLRAKPCVGARRQVPARDLAAKHQLDTGAVQALQEAASKYAGRLSAFCERLGYRDMEELLARFQVGH